MQADRFCSVSKSSIAVHAVTFNVALLYFPSVCARNENIFFVDNVLAFSRPGIGITLIYMGVEAILFFAITLLVEVREIEGKTRGIDLLNI